MWLLVSYRSPTFLFRHPFPAVMSNVKFSSDCILERTFSSSTRIRMVLSSLLPPSNLPYKTKPVKILKPIKLLRIKFSEVTLTRISETPACLFQLELFQSNYSPSNPITPALSGLQFLRGWHQRSDSGKVFWTQTGKKYKTRNLERELIENKSFPPSVSET